ncbi:MerR family transcriptional regulator [Planomonospora corallina]|uniref:MerR family transcriptional regulator n=1 Tax=Planomonospora corallina TaxID=1806052 RepID=A0ABV8I775_9ACTN
MEWTIGELVERASAALPPAVGRGGRGRDVPNERLVRWYATIGLLDPPSARRGRVALYGRRHLLQLVAVKRRQAEGRSIAQIQAELTGATDRTLEAIARLDALPEETAAGGAPRSARPRFWAGRPAGDRRPAAAPAADPPAADSLATASSTETSLIETSPTTASPAVPAMAVPALRLAPGVALLLDGAGRTPSHDDLTEIAAAAETLLTVLRERGLASPEGQQ